MDMKVIRSERRMCLCCMEEHEVKTVLVKEHATFKNRQVAYDALYTFCDVTEELYNSHKLTSKMNKTQYENIMGGVCEW